MVLGLGLWTRLASSSSLVADGEFFVAGGDSAYHLRRIMRSAESFPSVSTHDPYMDWPLGGLCHWAPGMDFLGALMIRLSGLAPWSTEAALTAAMLPVLSGILALALVLALAERLCDDAHRLSTILTAGFVMAVLPQAVATSAFGRVDHHIFEVLCMGALGLWVLWRQDVRKDSAHGRRWLWETLGAATLVLGLWTFAGSVLYAGLATAMLLVDDLLGGRRRSTPSAPRSIVGSGAPAFAIAAALIVFMQTPLAGPPFSFIFPSHLQPMLLGLAAVSLFGSSWAGRRGFVAALTGCGLLLAVQGDAGLQLCAALEGGLAAEDPWIGSIAEFQPILAGAPLQQITRLFGPFGLLGLPCLGLALYDLANRRPRAACLFGLWTLALLALSLLQLRFGRLFTVNLALCVGLALAPLGSRLPARIPLRPLQVPAFALILILLSPATRASLQPSPERPIAPVEEAALFLRTTETTKMEEDPGVAAPWDMGHFILWHSHRPVVSTGFGTYLSEASYQETKALWKLSEPRAVQWMKSRRLGHIVAGAATYLGRVEGANGSKALIPDEAGRAVLNPDFVRRFPLAGSLVGGSGIPGAGVPHFEELRPVFASSGTVDRAAMSLPALWAFERVAPTTIQGNSDAPAGTPVLLRVDLDVRGALFPWMAISEVNSEGSWEIRLPLLPGETGSVRTPRTAQLKVGDHAPKQVVLPVPISAAVRDPANNSPP